MTADLYLLYVDLPPRPRSFKRKARGNEVAACVWTCRSCGWQGPPCATMAETRRRPDHQCSGKGRALVAPSASARRAAG